MSLHNLSPVWLLKLSSQGAVVTDIIFGFALGFLVPCTGAGHLQLHGDTARSDRTFVPCEPPEMHPLGTQGFQGKDTPRDSTTTQILRYRRPRHNSARLNFSCSLCLCIMCWQSKIVGERVMNPTKDSFAYAQKQIFFSLAVANCDIRLQWQTCTSRRRHPLAMKGISILTHTRTPHTVSRTCAYRTPTSQSLNQRSHKQGAYNKVGSLVQGKMRHSLKTLWRLL